MSHASHSAHSRAQTMIDLPALERGSVAFLTARGEVIIATDQRIATYRLDERRCLAEDEVYLDEPVTALVESNAGMLAAAGNAICRLSARGAQELLRVEGIVRSMAATSSSVFAVVGRAGRLDATLVEFDPVRAAVVSERSLGSDAIALSTDPEGTYLGLADGMGFRTLRLRPDEPCRPPTERPQSESPGAQHTKPGDDHCHSHRCCDANGNPQDKVDDPGTGCNPSQNESRCPVTEPCDHGQSGVPTPDGGRIVGNGSGVAHYPPAGTPWRPFSPCRSHLYFDVKQLQFAGHQYVLAQDREARNIAVLAASDLRILHRAHYRNGAVLLSHPTLPLMLTFDHARQLWTRTYLGEFELSPIDIGPAFNPDMLVPSEMIWTGSPLPVLKGNYAPASGHKRVLVIPLLDPGQAFNVADLGKFAGYMKRVGFERVHHFYRENSFGMLSGIDFSVFGVHAGPGGPVMLSKPVSEYYHPLYIGAHVDLVKSGLSFPFTVVLDGRERLILNVQPMTGGRPPSTLEVEMYALLSSGMHNAYPAEVRFDGTETAAMTVRTPGGANVTLNLAFTPIVVTFNSDADIPAGLADISSYLAAVIAAAETAAGIFPGLFAMPKVRRVDQGEGGLGLLVTTLSHLATTGPKLEVSAITFTGAADPLGLKSTMVGRMTVTAANAGRLAEYLDYVTVLAQEQAGFNYAERRLAPTPVVTVTAGTGTLTTQFFIVDEDGGPGATMSVSGIQDMGALFDTATSVANTDVTAGRSATPKDGEAGSDGLISEVFTAAAERLAPPGQHLAQKDTLLGFFAPYDCIILGVVHPAQTHATDPDFVQPHEWWHAGPTSWAGHHRAVNSPRTAVFRPHPKEIMHTDSWILAPLGVKPDAALFCHEFGHAIGLDDLYQREAGYRDDLIYMESWAMMGNHGNLPHHCGYHKWQANWIPMSRIHTIERPKEDETLTSEVLLVPVEHWHDNDALVGQAHAAFARPELPVVQLVELSLGGDADVFGLIEARQQGAAFSQYLPTDPAPAVLVSHCIVWWDTTRYAFNGRYRAPAHLLHGDRQLVNAGDTFDLARGKELPMKGIAVSIVDRKNVAGVEVFLIRVVRKHNKEFIDLFFSTSDPYYKNPDLWVDWTGNNLPPDGKLSSTDPIHVRDFPLGQPVDQGEKIVVPDLGEELHWMVARLRNVGNVHAEQVKLNFSICEPPGAGDRGNFKVRSSVTIPKVEPTGHDKPMVIPSPWPVPAGFKGHTCIMVEVADLKVPLDHTGAALASDDVWQANNRAQKNVDQIGPKQNSPYAPVTFEFSVNNSARWPEVAYLEPEGLPYGMRLTVSPKRRIIAAGETAIFRCMLELDDALIDASCRGDHDFRINAWRVDGDSAVLWGGVEYQVRPRKGSATDINGSWYDNDVEITGHVAPSNITGSVRIRLAYSGQHARWVSVDLKPGGTFSYAEKAPAGSFELLATALFEGNKYYSESRSPQRRIKPPPPLH